MAEPTNQGQRVRVGLTGLACVFLLVMLAAVFLRAAGADGRAAPHGNAAGSAAPAAAPNEPLAALGVAPGNPAPAAASPGPRSTPPPR